MNPLLQPSSLRHSAIPFDQIRTEHFAPALDLAIATGHRRLAELKSKPASFDNTLRGLESATEEMEFVFGLFSKLLSANGDEEMQKLSLELGPKVASFANDVTLDPEIFARISEVYQKRDALPLTAEQRRLVERTYREFERSGAGLSDDKKQRLRAIDERLSQLSPLFRDNVLKATNAFELWIDDEKDLAGLPSSQRQAARMAATERGQPQRWLFTLHRPSYAPFLQFADNRILREKMERAFRTMAFKAPFDNQPILLETVRLSTEKAQLLGFKTYAHYALQLRMAETPEQVMSFLDRLLGASRAKGQQEMLELQTFVDSVGGPKPLQMWDFAYYSEKLKEKMYAFDEESLRPYFKLENVLAGVFEFARRLYRLEFLESLEYPVYHPDVKVFEVYQTGASREFIGLFYADFFPRPSKSQGAWMTSFYDQGPFRGQAMRPHISIVCNFTKPTNEAPSLLSYDEVQTLFHEMGHALHGLLSKVEHRTLSGTNVYQDFVELPSQFFENWATEQEALMLFARHYQTNDPIPAELVQKMKRAELFQVGYLTMRQLNFAYLDMAWFLTPPAESESVAEFETRITAATRLLPPLSGANISASFSHIFGGGYAAGYYAYKWAEALEADAFELFRERGLFDQEAAHRFEEFILSKGDSDHPMRLYEKFRGRAPDPLALLRRDGLLTSTGAGA